MTEIVVKKDFSAAQERKAALAAARFRKSKFTSAASNLLNTADLGNTVLLCDEHVKQFATPSVLRRYGYRQADAVPTAMGLCPHVMGNCDYCQLHTRCTMFIHEALYAQVWKSSEQRKRDREYGALVKR